jgi:hypothetical protein
MPLAQVGKENGEPSCEEIESWLKKAGELLKKSPDGLYRRSNIYTFQPLTDDR